MEFILEIVSALINLPFLLFSKPKEPARDSSGLKVDGKHGDGLDGRW